jgi:predicted ATPase
MLTRVYIDNFLCFVNFEYRPEIKQLLLGPNGSGKSSLLTAIRNLKQFVRGDENPFTQSTRTRWQDRPLQVFELAARLDDQDYEYRVEIRFAPETREQSVQLERLTVSGNPVFELTKGEIRFFPSNASNEPMAVPFRATKSALQLSQLSNSHVRRFVEWVETIHCFRIDVYPGAMDEVADSEEQQPDDELQNFAPWYRHLVQTYPEDNVLFLKSIKDCLDGFQALRFASDEDGTRKLWADFTGPKKRVSYKLSELSEGQRYLLALYAVLHFGIARRETVFVDEPDNFISLREIQPWLLAADQTVLDGGGQLILISHHPELLNQWAPSYGLRFFREGNAQVRTEKFRTDPEGILQPSELIARGWE